MTHLPFQSGLQLANHPPELLLVPRSTTRLAVSLHLSPLTSRLPLSDLLSLRFPLSPFLPACRSSRTTPQTSDFSPLGIIGSDRRRMPVASKIAFPTAGARVKIGDSPAPADGRSLRSIRTVSRAGTSLKRGTR